MIGLIRYQSAQGNMKRLKKISGFSSSSRSVQYLRAAIKTTGRTKKKQRQVYTLHHCRCLLAIASRYKKTMAASTLSQCSSIQLKSSLPPPKSVLPLSKETAGFRRCFAGPIKASSSSSKAIVKNNNNSIIVIDNYDSFTYNLCQYVGEMGCNFEVYRNDEVTVDELRRKNPRGIVISPGPDKGISVQTILELGPTVPIFGVCLGLQCIGEAFGGEIVPSPSGAVLGKSSLIYYNNDGEENLFTGLSNPFAAARYHRFVIGKDNFPSDALEITAWTEDGLIMAARHKIYRHLQGVQFHPESIITSEGKKIVGNFIKLIES